jgi:hypothetical protein
MYIPVNKNGQTVYELQLWYLHDLNDLPITHLPSVIKNIKGVYYRDSYLSPAFQYLDEVITSFSNDQGVSTLHNNPILVVGDIECPDCGGQKYINQAINAKNVMGGEPKRVKCSSCSGTGRVSKPGSHDIIKLSAPLPGEDQSVNDKVFYVNPEVRVLEHSTQRWLTMLQLAKRSIYMDVLEDTGSESGVAKGLRLEGLKDLMKRFGDDVIDCVTNIMNIKEMLYVPDENERKYINIVKPMSYDVETEEMLLERTKDALVVDRYETQMSYIRQKYRGDELQIRAYELSYLWCPLLMYSDPTEIQNTIDNGVYRAFDLKRRDYAQFIMKEILIESNYPETQFTLPRYFELADTKLTEYGIIENIDLTPVDFGG